MATIKFFVNGKERKSVPVYIRVIAGRKETPMKLIDKETGLMECKVCGEKRIAEHKTNSKLFVRGSWQCKKGCDPDPGEKDLIVKSGLTVDPHTWSNTTETIKQRIRTEADEKLIKTLSGLREHITNELRIYTGDYSKDWLKEVIDEYNGKKSKDAKTLNDYIEKYIADCESGERKNKKGMNFPIGTIRDLKGFQQVFNEYQGIYSDKRLKRIERDNKRRANENKPVKELRELKRLDFDSITGKFYGIFVKYLTAEGYGIGTKGRFIKDLKMFMKKSMIDELHSNKEFESYEGLSGKSFSVYLTISELNKIFNLDLSQYPELDKSRDAFLTMCDTGLRISDYSKVDVNIHTDETGIKLLYITQRKTGDPVVIPVSARLQSILDKYSGVLPRTHDQYINRDIKTVARMAGIDEILTWPAEKFGMKSEKSAPKWLKISCHAGRRSFCTNAFLAGIPTISIMKISGHHTEFSFMRYIKVTAEQNARLLANHTFFTGLKAV